MAKIRIWVKVVDDKTGEVLVDRESHSWVIQFPQILQGMMCGSFIEQVRDTTNNLRTVISTVSYMNVNAAATVVTYGIVVGTGTTAESATQYQLTTQVLHGNTVGKVMYGATTVTESSTAGTTAIFSIARTFTNSYATTDLAVKEIGIYCQTGSYYYMLARDLENITITKGGGAKTITYTVTVDNTS